MSEEKEYVEVTLQLPKPALNFYRALAAFHNVSAVGDYLKDVLIENIDSLVESIPRGFLIKQYGLEDYSSIPLKK